MRKVMNVSNQAVVAVVDGQTLRFNAREKKDLDAIVVDHPDFKLYSDLRVIGQVEHPILEITPQPEPVIVEESIVVADIEVQEPEVVEVVKPKRRKRKIN